MKIRTSKTYATKIPPGLLIGNQSSREPLYYIAIKGSEYLATKDWQPHGSKSVVHDARQLNKEEMHALYYTNVVDRGLSMYFLQVMPDGSIEECKVLANLISDAVRTLGPNAVAILRESPNVDIIDDKDLDDED